MLKGTIIKRAEYNYEEHVCFFNQRVKENLTQEELLKFPQYYYERACFTNIPSLEIITNKIQEIYNIIKDINETNYENFITDDRLGICFNLDVKIHGYEDEDNHDVYDVIYAMSRLCFNKQNDVRLYSHPIPLHPNNCCSTPISLWSDQLLEFRLQYLNWLSKQFISLIPLLEKHGKQLTVQYIQQHQ